MRNNDVPNPRAVWEFTKQPSLASPSLPASFFFQKKLTRTSKPNIPRLVCNSDHSSELPYSSSSLFFFSSASHPPSFLFLNKPLKSLLCHPCSPSSSVPLDRHLKLFWATQEQLTHHPLWLPAFFGCPRNGSFSSAPFFLFFLSSFYRFLKNPSESSTANPGVTHGCLKARHLAKN